MSRMRIKKTVILTTSFEEESMVVVTTEVVGAVFSFRGNTERLIHHTGPRY